MKPTVISVVSNPTSGKAGDKIGVTATFSVAVDNATAKLGTSDVTWKSGEDTAVWVGEVEIPTSSETDMEWTYTIQGFSDTHGNLGEPITTGSVYLTPSITVDVISGGVINSSDITNVVVSGNTSRFDDSQKVTLVLSNSKDAQTETAEANVQGDGSWSMVAQDLTGWPDGEVTATVTGSNQHGIAAEAVTETATLSTAKPTLISVVSNPTSGKTGDKIGVTATFSVAVDNATATLGTSDVTWDSGQGSATWTGEVEIPSSSAVDTEFAYTVKGFSDTHGNLGELITSGAVYLTPSITITPITGGVINESDAANLIISGTTTRFDAGKEITVVFSNSKDSSSLPTVIATVDSDGNWTAGGANLSSWSDGTITVKATGSNQHNIAAKEASETAQLSTEKPTLISVISNPTSGKAGDKIGVTATFSVAVNNATAKLDASDVTWKSGEDTVVWVGEVTIPSSSAADTEFTYTVKGFSDTHGNLGDESTSGAVYLTPSITITPITGGVINESDAANLIISGTTTRFDAGKEITVAFSNSKDSSSLPTVIATVDSDGNWTAAGANLSSWSDGTITVKATGSNQHGIAADEVTSKADLVTTKPIVSNVTLNPINPSNGDSVQVTIRFNENVSDVSGSLGQPIDFSSVTAPTNEWVGTISSLNVGVESKKDLIVSAGYKDTSGNFGDEYTEQVNVTPVNYF
ncbi:hypothetical protein A6E04_15805 [Aliivibrio logei]|uniref:Bacterial Ig-like domain-containing protein n=1 Tax=Aliivibrio logei TaxID=688 RepID=A0A1B9NWA6_ALILO|nr:hypothetical protein A6E04_15805 [Aliivibrio logei]